MAHVDQQASQEFPVHKAYLANLDQMEYKESEANVDHKDQWDHGLVHKLLKAKLSRPCMRVI